MKPYGSKLMDAFEDPTIRKNGYYHGQCNDGSIQAQANKKAIEEQLLEYNEENLSSN